MIAFHNDQKVKDKRVSMGLSQAKLAKLTGVSRFKISQYELGYAGISDRDLSKLNTILKSNKCPTCGK